MVGDFYAALSQRMNEYDILHAPCRQGGATIKPTSEQSAVVGCEVPSLAVEAFAGAAKTTTAVMFANARPKDRLIYVAFNKAVQLEATRKFPSNTRCVTSHSLAFPGYGSGYANAGKLVPKIRVTEVSQALALDRYLEQWRYLLADACIKTLNRFLGSRSDAVTTEMTKGLLEEDAPLGAGELVELTESLWSKMCDRADPSIGMVHDGYLKLYALSAPVLHYDYVLLDEAQDTNPVTAEIAERQPGAKVMIGDTHQAIYGFRMAYDAMRRFRVQKRLALTRSFRFGQAIADVANGLLQTFKGERKLIVGNGEEGVVGAIGPGEKQTVLARTNSMVFDEAVSALHSGRAMHFVGGISGYRFSDILDGFRLSIGQLGEVRNPYLRSFQSYARLEEFAQLTDDKELKSLLRVVSKYGREIPRLVREIEAMAVPSHASAQVVLSTAHKAKGLEWDYVRLTEDFTELFDPTGSPLRFDPGDIEEVNILYVAATRARKRLQPTEELVRLLEYQAVVKRFAKMPEWARPLACN